MEILNFYRGLFPAHQPKATVQPVMHLASQALSRDQPEEEKLSLQSEQSILPMEEAIVEDVPPLREMVLANEVVGPEMLESEPIERRLSSPTISPSSESERSMSVF